MARGPNVTKAKKGERHTAKSAKYVVAIDFGTAFSGAAFARLADFNSIRRHGDDDIHLNDIWPGQEEAGAKTYCKTQTSVWYMPGSTPGTFDLKGWGWAGYLGYIKNAQSAGVTIVNNENPSRASDRCANQLYISRKRGYFLTNFKLGLAEVPQNLPDGLEVKRVISDYLRALSRYILKLLHTRYSSDSKSQREVQYVFTVPALWNPKMRQDMKDCAEMAGMIAGISCKDDDAASQHDLIIVTEPEAAAVHVHKTLDTANFRNGDRFLVVDVGGGTTDVIAHEKIGSTTRRNVRVKEISASKGELNGGIHVDEEFFNYLRRRISCFSSFEQTNPCQIWEINRWWNDIKCSFNGDVKAFQMTLSAKLSRAWKRFDRENNIDFQLDYESLLINSSDIKNVFDKVVNKILRLVNDQPVPNLKAILVVGGFSNSLYLQAKMRKAFKEHAKTINFVSNAGSAIVRGAAWYGVEKECTDMVGTRIASRTIGFDTAWPFDERKHRKEYIVIDDEKQELCDNIFGVLIRKGQEIPSSYVRRAILTPMYRRGIESDGDAIEVNLYETRAKNPRYVTDKGVRKLTTCCISVPKKQSLGRNPKLELLVHFGTLMRASVEGKNFSGKRVSMPPVKMRWTALDAS